MLYLPFTSFLLHISLYYRPFINGNNHRTPQKKTNNTVFLSNMPRIARAYLENMTYNLSLYIYIYILFNFLLIFYILYNNIIKVSLINKLVKKAMCSFGQRF